MLDKKAWKTGYGQAGVAALCAAGLFFVLYGIKGLYPFGNGSVMMTDLYSQYVPLLYRFYDVVSGQKNVFLDFSISGGANLYVDTINEILNPFNYILFLFGREKIYLAVNVLLVLYVAAAAASADFFLLKIWKNDRRWNLVLSLCYALSGYTMYNYQIIKWMYFPVLFPLFLLALYRLLTEKKGGWYALLLGYQLALSIQLGFMTLLFTLFGCGIYFGAQGARPEDVLRGKKRGRESAAAEGKGCGRASAAAEGKGRGRESAAACGTLFRQETSASMCRLGLYTVCGLLLSGAVLLPNVLVLLNSSRAGENLSYFGVMKRHGLDDLFERLFQIAHPVLLGMGGWAVRVLYRAKKAKDGGTAAGASGKHRLPVQGCRKALQSLSAEGKFWIALNVFLWLTVLLEPANLLWHMGSYVCFPVRYGYMVLLCGCGLTKWLLAECEGTECVRRIACREVPKNAGGIERGGIQARPREACPCVHFKVSSIAMPVFWAAALELVFRYEERIVQAFGSLAISKTCPKETMIVCGALVLLILAALCAMVCRWHQRIFAAGAALVCGLAFGVMIFLPKNSQLRAENEEAYRKMNSQRQEAEQNGDGAFFRAEDDASLPLNAALINGSNSLSGYIPTADGQYQRAMEELGYLTPWVSTYSVGGSRVSDALLSVKKEDADGVFSGVIFEKSAEDLQLNGNTVLERQEELARALTGKSLLERYEMPEADGDGAFRLTVEGQKALYLDCGQPAGSICVLVNGESLEIPENNSAESPDRLICLGIFTEEEVAVCVTDRGGNVLPMENMELGALDVAAWEETRKAVAGEDADLEETPDGTEGKAEGVSQKRAHAEMAQALDKEQLAVVEGKGRIVVRPGETRSGQTLFLPFAALDGWHCEINGESVDITPVFGGFMGITLQDGQAAAQNGAAGAGEDMQGYGNEIVLRFTPPGFPVGLILTLTGVLGLTAAAARKAGEQKRTAGRVRAKVITAAAGAFWLLFAAALLLIYVIPAIGLVCYLGIKVLGAGRP